MNKMKKKITLPNVGEDTEELKFLYTLEKILTHFKNTHFENLAVSNQVKHIFTPFLSIFQREMKTFTKIFTQESL